MLQSAAASHFTQKRLEYINETAFDMAPIVEQLERVDFEPITKSVQDLTRDAEQHNRNVKALYSISFLSLSIKSLIFLT